MRLAKRLSLLPALLILASACGGGASPASPSAAPASAQLPIQLPIPVPGQGAAIQPYGTNDAGGFRNVLPPGEAGTDNAGDLATDLVNIIERNRLDRRLQCGELPLKPSAFLCGFSQLTSQ